ncbi:hypothetical protein ACIRRI_48265 [Streptomyces mirabilis]|uniref:hypothetical protein n=1 Tax=Streptomyces mirabilis TaxID=68239 RepID=UPI0037FED2C7
MTNPQDLRRKRWLFAPITSWQARRLAKTTGMDHDTAWQEIRTVTHPDEAVYKRREQSEGS